MFDDMESQLAILCTEASNGETEESRECALGELVDILDYFLKF